MAKRDFRDLIENRWGDNKFVCVGLDSNVKEIPHSFHCIVNGVLDVVTTTIRFNRVIIEATAGLALAFKLNSADYEASGPEGYTAMKGTIKMIHQVEPGAAVIIDGKRGDTHDTNIDYACSLFDEMRADAVTVNPYFSGKALLPFLERKEKGVFVVCLSSQEDEAEEFQYLPIVVKSTERSAVEKFLNREVSHDVLLYEYVAFRTTHVWNKNRNCGIVVGATHTDELGGMRNAVDDDMLILSPGIGAQGGDTYQAFSAGKNKHGEGLILSSSRSIIFASTDNVAEAAHRETKKIAEEIHRARLKHGCHFYDGQASSL